MNRSANRAFRPTAECVEERIATTGGVAAAALAEHAVNIPAHHHGIASMVHGAHGYRHHGVGASSPGRVGTPGMNHFRLPSSFLDWGVVTLWNNTNSTVSFWVSASTYNNGQFYQFTLQSGGVQSYFAQVVNGRAPLFRVSFSPTLSNPISLPQDNIVFQSTTWVPSGTAGWPYAINFGVNGYSIAPI